MTTDEHERRTERIGGVNFWIQMFMWSSLGFLAVFSLLAFETDHWLVEVLLVLNLAVFVSTLGYYLTEGQRGISP